MGREWIGMRLRPRGDGNSEILAAKGVFDKSAIYGRSGAVDDGASWLGLGASGICGQELRAIRAIDADTFDGE